MVIIFTHGVHPENKNTLQRWKKTTKWDLVGHSFFKLVIGFFEEQLMKFLLFRLYENNIILTSSLNFLNQSWTNNNNIVEYILKTYIGNHCKYSALV